MTSDKSCREHSWLEPYTPINVLKPVASNVWIVDGPEISLVLGFLKVPFSARMTIVRLRNGDLILHSPVAHTSALQSAVEILGPIRYLVSPNSLHYWWWFAQPYPSYVLVFSGEPDKASE